MEISDEQAEWFENGVKITFTHADNLEIRGDYLEDAYVYNEVGVAFTVDSEIDGNALILTWAKGIVGARVSMGYSNNPTHNLYNGDGYLASGFSLENEELIDAVTTVEEVDNYVS